MYIFMMTIFYHQSFKKKSSVAAISDIASYRKHHEYDTSSPVIKSSQYLKLVLQLLCLLPIASDRKHCHCEYIFSCENSKLNAVHIFLQDGQNLSK